MRFEIRSSDLETGLSSSVGTDGAETDSAAFIPVSSQPSISPPPQSFHAFKEKCSLNEETFGRFRDRFQFPEMFAMTSMGGKVDNRVNDGRSPYIFRLNGQTHHRIGTLLPNNGEDPQFAQLYFYDTENEVQHRMDAFGSSLVNKDLDPSIVDALVQMFDESNNLVKIFPMSRAHFIEHDIHCLTLHLIGS